MDTKYKNLQVRDIEFKNSDRAQQKYEGLKRETIDLRTKIEYFKKRQEYEARKIDFLKNVYRRLVRQ